MGTRTETRSKDNTPAPTSYNLGSTVGAKTSTLLTSPAHSMGGRTLKGSLFRCSSPSHFFAGSFADDLAKTPGPGKYNASAEPIKTKPPAYSLQGRTYVPAGIFSLLSMLVFCPPPRGVARSCCLFVDLLCTYHCRQHKEAWSWHTQPRACDCSQGEGTVLLHGC